MGIRQSKAYETQPENSENGKRETKLSDTRMIRTLARTPARGCLRFNAEAPVPSTSREFAARDHGLYDNHRKDCSLGPGRAETSRAEHRPPGARLRELKFGPEAAFPENPFEGQACGPGFRLPDLRAESGELTSTGNRIHVAIQVERRCLFDGTRLCAAADERVRVEHASYVFS